MFEEIRRGENFDVPDLSHLGEGWQIWDRAIRDMLCVDPIRRPSSKDLHEEFLRGRMGRPLKMARSLPKLSSMSDNSMQSWSTVSVEQYLNSNFSGLMSEIKKQQKPPTPWEANESTGGNVAFQCQHRIGRGGSGFVFQVRAILHVSDLS